MTAMVTELELCDIDVDCIIGDLPEERLVPQRLLVTVRLTVTGAADTSDALADTVDYAALTQEIRRVLVAAHCRLIERAARLVAETCRADPRVTAVTATVEKRGSVPHLAAARATVTI